MSTHSSDPPVRYNDLIGVDFANLESRLSGGSYARQQIHAAASTRWPGSVGVYDAPGCVHIVLFWSLLSIYAHPSPKLRAQIELEAKKHTPVTATLAVWVLFEGLLPAVDTVVEADPEKLAIFLKEHHIP